MIEQYFTIQDKTKNFERTVYLFGGWRIPSAIYQPLIRDFQKNKYGCVFYIPKHQLIAEGTAYDEIVNAVDAAVHDVHDRREKKGNPEDIVFGTSFGTAVAAAVAKQEKLQKQVLVAPFGDFAEHVKAWPSNKRFLRVLNSQSYDHTTSGEVLNKVRIFSDPKDFLGKKTVIYYGQHDTVLHTENIEREIAPLADNKDVVIVPVKGRHLPSILRAIMVHNSYFKELY